MGLNQNTKFVYNNLEEKIDYTFVTTKYIDELTEEEKNSLNYFNCGDEEFCASLNSHSQNILATATKNPNDVIFLTYNNPRTNKNLILGFIYFVKDYFPKPSEKFGLSSSQYVLAVQAFAIDKKYQKQGLGHYFLTEFISSLSDEIQQNVDSKLKALYGITNNPKARALYLDLGAIEHPKSYLYILNL